MHPALDPKQLQRLPVSVRRFATAALKSTATAETIDRLACRLEISRGALRARIPADQANGLLPICFVHLDPNAIPSPDDLDILVGEGGKVFPTIARSIAVLRLLFRYVVSASVPHGTESWLLPRVWAWFRFLDDHHALFWRAGLQVHTSEPVEGLTCDDSHGLNATDFSFFVSGLYNDAQLARLSPATTFRAMEGFGAVVGRALACVVRSIIQNDSLLPVEIVWRVAVCMFRQLSLFDLRCPATLTEVADGAGGMQELADLTISMLRLTVKESAACMPVDSVLRECTFHRLLRLVDGGTAVSWSFASGVDFSLPKVPLAALSAMLVRRGIIPALVEALGLLHTFCEPPLPAYIDSLRLLLRLLYQRMVEVLPTIRELFDKVLSGAVFYHHTAVKLREAIAAVESLVSTPARVSPSLAILEQPGLSLAACDNLVCCRIDSKTEFRRCSACQAVYYCSTACQEADWEDGHRDSCSARPPWVLASHLQQVFPYHDRWFLRALLHHHYEEHFDQILLAHIEHLVFANCVAGSCSKMEMPRAIVFDFSVPVQPAISTKTQSGRELCDALKRAEVE
ncbi:hypothetical protein C8F01DRAFT_1365814 [Mycena amicta]|nr:hypothetical protein C8F01DRAFT_1365814 [Mycena amicta]